jgi:hypothetical protein
MRTGAYTRTSPSRLPSELRLLHIGSRRRQRQAAPGATPGDSGFGQIHHGNPVLALACFHTKMLW